MCLFCTSDAFGRIDDATLLTLPNKLQDLEIFGAVMPLVRFLEPHLKVDLPSDILVALTSFQLEPAFEVGVILTHARTDLDKAEEGVLIRAIIDVDI